MKQFRSCTSLVVPLLANDIDTDQIIPARFLKATTKTGLGAHLFADWRYGPGMTPVPDFVLNRPGAAGARILLAGDNFGCGSSREHAPWALTDFGFRAVISTSFADIFRGNAMKNGLLPVAVDQAEHAEICALVLGDPAAEVTVDLEAQEVRLPGGRTLEFRVDAFARTCLLNGVDELGYLQSFTKAIEEFEGRHPVPSSWPQAEGRAGR
jgi:3-isopropylmalate/(R)-2-methylmalate dehydratase small subunit